MTMFSTSKQLIKNTKNFLEIKRYTLLARLLLKSGTFYGWGRKKSGFRAMGLIVEHNISKYNNASDEIPNQVWNDGVGVGNDCVCFGMAFYAGWGITTDKSQCQRRKAKRSVEEVFAAAYILYTRYYNPYTNKPSDIFDTIETIVRMRGF